jgi:hypothetical protein
MWKSSVLFYPIKIETIGMVKRLGEIGDIHKIIN